MSGSARNGSTLTREERLEWARKVRDYKISAVFFPKDREEQIAALQALEGDALLALAPEPKWFGHWNKPELAWDTVAKHTDVGLILDRGLLKGRVITEVLSATDPAVLRLEEGFAAFGALYVSASEASLLEWGIITQEQFDEIKNERYAAHNDRCTRESLRLEIEERKKALEGQRASLVRELKAFQERLANADQLSPEELTEIVKKVVSLKESIAELEQLMEQEDALRKSYQYPRGTNHT